MTEVENESRSFIILYRMFCVEKVTFANLHPPFEPHCVLRSGELLLRIENLNYIIYGKETLSF